MKKETIVLDDMFFNIDDLLNGLAEYFAKDNRNFSVIGKSSSPVVNVDGVKYRAIVTSNGIALGCQKIILKEER